MAKTLIMIPGFMCDERLFEPQIRALGQRYDIRVICPDASETDMAQIAQSVLQGAPETFALFGLSMGAIIAMEVVKKAASRVERLALFDCNALPDTPENSVERNRQIELVSAGHLPEVMTQCHIARYFKDGLNSENLVQLCLDMAESRGAEAFVNHQTALIRRRDQRASLEQAKMPTLIACGEFDVPCPLGNHKLIQNLVPHAKLQVIAGAGHLPTIEQPEKTTQLIDEWLR